MTTRIGHPHIERQSPWLPPAAVALTLLVLAVALFLVGIQLRTRLQAQILARDAEVINAIAALKGVVDESGLEQSEDIEDPLDHLAGVIEASERRDTLLVRLFDAEGRFITAVPLGATEIQLSSSDLGQVQSGEPVSRYLGDTALADHFLSLSTNDLTFPVDRMPLAEVLIPIRGRDPHSLLGVAQVILDGRRLRQEYATLDRDLIRHGGLVFLACATLLVLVLGWSFGRLEKTQRLLKERTVRLLQANHERVLAAKTSALGNVAAHLIHGLKNPLSGLQNFVHAARQEPAGLDPTEVRDAAAAAHRMQTMIQDVVRVMQEEQTVSQYEVTFNELAEILRPRMTALAAQAKVTFRTQVTARGQFDNRNANLVLLILENLIQNAIQASPPEGEVILSVRHEGNGVAFVVRDEGPGLPSEIAKSLFQPVKSTRSGGSGLGLAISHQLALQLPGELSLRHSGADGCVFMLHVPRGSASVQPCPAPVTTLLL